MNTPFDIEKAHRWFAVEYNNGTWDLLEKPNRSEEETDEMIHRAHASVLHWAEAGTRINALRGYYLLTNVYSAVGDGPSALRYGMRSLAIKEERPEGMADWDIAFIFDAVARAHSAAGDLDKAREYRDRAREAGEAIAGEEDRKIFDATFQNYE